MKAKKPGQSFTSFVECRVEFWLACNKWMQMQRLRSGLRAEARSQMLGAGLWNVKWGGGRQRMDTNR